LSCLTSVRGEILSATKSTRGRRCEKRRF
jgi:hypothetical protein